MIHHCSITSRTGYDPKTKLARVRDSLAIISSIVGVGALIFSVGFLSQWMG